MNLRPGDVRSAHVPSRWHTAAHAHKRRPVILVAAEGSDRWRVAALTKLTKFRNGEARMPVPGWMAAGLDAQPFLWSERLVTVPVADIDMELIGRAPVEMVEAITVLLGLPSRYVDAMLGLV